MTPEDAQQLQAYIQGIAKILYKNTPESEKSDSWVNWKVCASANVRTRRSPSCLFFIHQVTGTAQGRPRQLKSCVGSIPITDKQASRLELPSHSRISPLLEKCCLRVSANESYQNAEAEIEALTGMKVGHTTLHRSSATNRIFSPWCQACSHGSQCRWWQGQTTIRASTRLSLAGIQGSASPRNLLQCCLSRQSVCEWLG